MARLAAKARCNYYPLPDREAELIRSCLTFPDQPFSALDPCAGEGRAMAVITGSSKAVRYGIELDAYRAEAAAKVLESSQPTEQSRTMVRQAQEQLATGTFDSVSPGAPEWTPQLRHLEIPRLTGQSCLIFRVL
jgi:hypothetical protein